MTERDELLAWANLGFGVLLIAWMVVTVGMLVTGFGLPFPGSELSLGAALGWCIWNRAPKRGDHMGEQPE